MKPFNKRFDHHDYKSNARKSDNNSKKLYFFLTLFYFNFTRMKVNELKPSSFNSSRIE